MFNAFDSYERHARVYPAILLAFPLVVTCYSFSSFANSNLSIKITSSSAIILVGVVLLSNVVRYLGKRIERKIWESWGGPPSTRFLRKDDMKIAREIKEEFYKKVKKESGIDLQNNLTDERINQSFGFVRSFLRTKDDKGLWNKFNREYGFARNLLGSRWVWVTLSFLLASICYFLIGLFPEDKEALIIGTVINCGYGLFAIFCGWLILPGLTRHIAERYAEEAIFAYMNAEHCNHKEVRNE